MNVNNVAILVQKKTLHPRIHYFTEKGFFKTKNKSLKGYSIEPNFR